MDRPLPLPDRVIAAAFRLAARLRSAKAVHPLGTVVDAEVRRHGLSPATGVAWIDEPGVDRAVVRFSRGAGLPAPLPDVLGLAGRVSSPEGDPRDLLLASSAERWPGRRYPLPRRHWRRPACSSVSAFHTARGPLLDGARASRHLRPRAAPVPRVGRAGRLAAAPRGGLLRLPRGPHRVRSPTGEPSTGRLSPAGDVPTSLR